MESTQRRDAADGLFDSIIIGSSPIAILEAVALKLANKNVLIVDDADRIGGAWATIEFAGCGNVEIGSHYITPDPKIHDFFREFMGIEMKLLDPQPKYLLPRRVFMRREMPYMARWAGTVARLNQASPMTSRFWRNRISPYYRAFRQYVGIGPKQRGPMKYFPEGTPQMIRGIEDMITEYDIPVRLNTRLTDVETDAEAGEVHVSLNGTRVKTRELVMTSCSSINQITTPSGTVQVPGEIIENKQLHLAFRGTRETFTIGYISDSDRIMFATNVSRFCTGRASSEGLNIICLYLNNQLPETDANVNAITDELKQNGLIDGTAELVDHKWSRIRLPQRSRAELDEVDDKLSPLIRTLFTHSFSHGISINSARWGKALRAAGRTREPVMADRP